MFKKINNEGNLYELLEDRSSIIMWSPVQAGKTDKVLGLVAKTCEYSYTVFISDKNTVLAKQTNKRSAGMGFSIINYIELTKWALIQFFKSPLPNKKIMHFLMEVNNLSELQKTLRNMDVPVTLIIDEGDKCRNVIKEVDDEEEEDTLPPISRKLLEIKNLLKEKKNGSRTVFVTATPQGLLVSEKDDWLVVYKEPYQNYIGVGIDHPYNGKLQNIIPTLTTNSKAQSRWTGCEEDIYYNTMRRPVNSAVKEFMALETKDSSICQLMLLSLENHNAPQERLQSYVKALIGDDPTVRILLLNGKTKEREDSLASMLREIRAIYTVNKIVVIAGFMASRGVSFTDFSDANNRFELVSQVHHTKKACPVNSAMQAMRIFGPARRTVSRPTLFCNSICAEDVETNFAEAYRVIIDMANGESQIATGNFNPSRPLTQSYNYRYMTQSASKSANWFLTESTNPEDHKPIKPVIRLKPMKEEVVSSTEEFEFEFNGEVFTNNDDDIFELS